MSCDSVPTFFPTSFCIVLPPAAAFRPRLTPYSLPLPTKVTMSTNETQAQVPETPVTVVRPGKTMSEALLNEKVSSSRFCARIRQLSLLREVCAIFRKNTPFLAPEQFEEQQLTFTIISGTAASPRYSSAPPLVCLSVLSPQCCCSEGEHGLHGLVWASVQEELGKSVITWVLKWHQGSGEVNADIRYSHSSALLRQRGMV